MIYPCAKLGSSLFRQLANQPNRTFMADDTAQDAMNFPPVETREGVTAETFRDQILPAARPILFKGLVKTWPAVQLGQRSDQALADYIKPMDSGQPTSVLEANANVQGRFAYGPGLHDFNFNRKSKTISAGLEQLLGLVEHPNPPYIYIQSTPIAQYLPGFVDDNPNPILPATITPRIWISNRTRAQTHNDNDHNLACVVAGRRRFTLFPPEQVKNLYIGPMDHTPSGRAISLANLEDPDFKAFPRFEAALATAQVADMEPGDALYVPKYWWHHVQSLSAFNILVNYWWGGARNAPENPQTTFMSALLALKDLPDAERAYWKAMFDHYIFQTDGDPVAHIPAAHQGGLGRMSASERAQMIRSLMQILNGR